MKENTCLQELYLYNNYIGDTSLDAFSTSLLQNKTNLHTIGLEFNSIGSEGAIKVLAVASQLKLLDKIYLNHNEIKKEAGQAIFEFLKNVP